MHSTDVISTCAATPKPGEPIHKTQSMAATPAQFHGIRLTTEDAHTLTDGPTIYIVENVQKMAKFFLQQTNIPQIVLEDILKKIESNNVIQQKIQWKYNPTLKMPANKNELAFYSLNQLGSLLRNKSITSVELTNFFLSRLKKYGDTLQCVISITESIALEQAKQADENFKKGIDKGPQIGRAHV